MARRDQILVSWDLPDAPTFRQQLFPPYQGGRDFDPELLDQLAILPDFVAACGFAAAIAPGYEADDFLAAAVTGEERRHGTALVASGGRDAFQLASTCTTILHPVKAGDMARIGAQEVRERYGVEPGQVPDFIALRGDPSDKIPGDRGVAPKRAAALLDQFGSLEQVLGAGHLTEQADELKLYKRLAAMDATAPLPAIADQIPRWNQAAGLAHGRKLGRLARQLGELSASAPR